MLLWYLLTISWSLHLWFSPLLKSWAHDSQLSARETKVLINTQALIIIINAGCVNVVLHGTRCALIHCGLVTPHGDRYLGDIGSSNGLLPGGTKPLLEPICTYLLVRFCGIHLRAILHWESKLSLYIMSLKSTFLKSSSPFLGPVNSANTRHTVCILHTWGDFVIWCQQI